MITTRRFRASDEQGPLSQADVRHTAMDLLAGREYSKSELAQKLAQRFERRRARMAKRAAQAQVDGALETYPPVLDGGAALVGPEMIAAALDRLESDGLLSDARFAEAFVRSRIARGQGPTRLRHDMRQKGLEAGMIDAALAAAEIDWENHAREILERRFGSGESADARERARRMRFLQQRGFSFDVCYRLLNQRNSRGDLEDW